MRATNNDLGKELCAAAAEGREREVARRRQAGAVRENNVEKVVYPAHKCTAPWFLRAGIGADGFWGQESDKPDTQKPLLLIAK